MILKFSIFYWAKKSIRNVIQKVFGRPFRSYLCSNILFELFYIIFYADLRKKGSLCQYSKDVIFSLFLETIKLAHGRETAVKELYLREQIREQFCCSGNFNTLPRVYSTQQINQDPTFKSMKTYQYFQISGTVLGLTTDGASYLAKRSFGRPKINQWNASGVKPGSLLEGRLEAEIANLRGEIPIPDGIKVSDHHIFPGLQIGILVTNALAHNKGKVLVEQYINSRKGITQHIIPQITIQENEKAAIDSVFCSIFWFRQNLILGPEDRDGDPGKKFDEDTCRFQSDQVIGRYDKINSLFTKKEYPAALQEFFKVRNTNAIYWQESAIKDGKKLYKPVLARRNFPGTAGYCYDHYGV